MRLIVGYKTKVLIYLVVFCLVIMVMTTIGFSEMAPITISFLYLLGMIVFLAAISNSTLKNSYDIVLFWGSFFIKILYALYRFPLADIANPSLSGDAGGFWRTAGEYYEGDFGRVYTPFPYILNCEFHIFGKNVICCCITNIVLSMIMVAIVIYSMNRLGIYGKSRIYAALCSAFLPYTIIVSNSILRESLYFAFISASFISYIHYIQMRRQKYIYLAILLLIPVLILHIGYFPIAAVYLVEMLTHETIKTKRGFLNKIIIILGFIVFVFFASQLNSVGYLTEGNGIIGIINKIMGANSDEVMGTAGSRYLAELKITSITSFVLYSPLKWCYFMFSPLPNNWRGIEDALAFICDGFIHLACIWITIRSIQKQKHNCLEGRHDSIIRIMRTGLWSVILCGFVFGLGTSTAGTAIRHRDAMIGIEAILIGISLTIRNGDLFAQEIWEHG